MSRHARSESIADIISSAAKDHDLVVLMSAFADASVADQNMIVASLSFRKSRILKFEKQWQLMLDQYDLPYFRMSACNAHKKPFEHLSAQQCDDVSRRAHELIVEYAEYGFFNALRMPDFEAIIPAGQLIDNPYAFLVYSLALGLAKISKDRKLDAKYAFFFESGDDGEGTAAMLLSRLFSLANWRDHIGYRSHTFIGKTDSLATQAADVLAWHVSKQISRIPKGLDMRGDLKALYSNLDLYWMIYDGESLVKLLDRVREKGPGAGKVAYHVLHGTNPALFREDGALERLLKDGT